MQPDAAARCAFNVDMGGHILKESIIKGIHASCGHGKNVRIPAEFVDAPDEP
jgi:hypothetical protein